MRTFLLLPQSDDPTLNIRINMDFVISYFYTPDNEVICFEMVNGKTRTFGLHNLDAKKIMKKLDSLSKPVKLIITKSDVSKA